MADKKTGDASEKPKNTLGFVGLGMILLASAWFTWEAVLRPETEKEKKERVDHENEKKRDASRKKRHGH